jgi:hypothetical protein
MPELQLNPVTKDDVLIQGQITKLLDALFGAEPENGPRVMIGVRIQPETKRRLEAIAKLHPGYEEKMGSLVADLLDGFARGFFPCRFCGHPYPAKVKVAKEATRK